MPDDTPSLVLALTPEQTEAFLVRLADPNISFNDLVSGYNTTPAALSAFMARPAIQARIIQLESAAATKARLTAISSLPAAAVTLRLAIQEHTHTLCNTPYNHQDQRQVEARSRNTERARKIIALNLRLASFHPSSPALPRPRRQRPSTGVLVQSTAAAKSAPTRPIPAGSPDHSAPRPAIPSPEHWTPAHTQDLRAAFESDPPPSRPGPTGVWLPFEPRSLIPTAWLQPPEPIPI